MSQFPIIPNLQQYIDRAHARRMVMALAYGGWIFYPNLVPSANVAEKGDRMSKKIELSPQCVDAIRKHVCSVFGLKQFDHHYSPFKRSKHPSYKDRLAFEVALDRLSLTLSGEDKDAVITLSVQQEMRYFSCEESDVDEYGYRRAPSVSSLTEADDAKIIEWLTKCHLKGSGDYTYRLTNSKRNYVYLTTELLNNSRKEAMDTTIGRYLVSRMDVPSDDQRLVELGRFLSEWAAKESPANVGVKMLKGKEVSAAYHAALGCSSCMTGNKSGYTEFYAANPDVINLAVMYSGVDTPGETACGRALVWISDDMWCVDRIYPENVKVQQFMKDKLTAMAGKAGKKINFHYNNSHGLKAFPPVRVKLGEGFKYPYMDSVRVAVVLEDGKELMVAADQYKLQDWVKKHGCGVAYDAYGNRSRQPLANEKVWVGTEVFAISTSDDLRQTSARYMEFVPAPPRPKPEPPKVEEMPRPKAVAVGPAEPLADGVRINFEAEPLFNPENHAPDNQDAEPGEVMAAVHPREYQYTPGDWANA